MDSPVKNKWDLVVKVKYGDVLRRFNVSVDGQDIDHDMDKLRTKIINLFKFNANANIVLTYTDIDGDVVTLVDDDELHDAVFRQHLDPLRINVQLETDSAARADTSPYLDTSSRTGTEGTLMPHLRSAIDDALKSVPDPLRSALSSISYDYVSKASASAPVFGKLTEHFSKLGQSCDTGSTTYNSSKSADCGGVSHIATNPLDHSSDDMLKPLHDPVPRNPPSSNSNAVNQIPEDNTLPPGSGVMTGSTEKLFEEIWPECSLKNLRKPAACHAKDKAEGKKVAETGVKSIATASVPSADHQTVYQGCYENIIQTTPSVPPGVTDVLCSDMKNIPCSTSPFMSDFGFNSQKRFPVNKHWSEPAALNQIPCGVPQVLPVCGSQKQLLDSMIRTFHKGVRCDGCGMHPIIGPRFKSNVKEDFDLCNICFSGVGNEADYTRIDRAPYRSPRILKEFNHLHSRFHAPPGSRAYGLRPHKGKLESRFIQDVTILDGTLMAPSTPFTKIWRMRNNGTLVWPSGTQLVWIGGDRFAERGSAELEIPVNGFPVDKEIDIAVDFRAPSRPGRYISYWRMASPSGQKFGQRVWVLIQVDASRPNSAGRIIYPELNLNLPPEGSEQGGVGSFYVNAEPLESVVPSKLDMPGTKDLVQPLVNEISNPSNGSPSVLATLNETSPSLPEMPPPSSSSSLYPIIDLSQPFVPTSELVAPPPEEASLGSWPAAGENPVELTLLKELEEMGFRQIDLNKEVLRSNDYDLEQSLNDLCSFSEWDPLLEELQEMGFSDRERNKKLLIKNGGSIKRVVLDLIAGERAE